MTAARRLVHAMALAMACACLPAGAAEGKPGDAGLALRLADGSLIRFACDRAEGASSCVNASASQSASLGAGPRRAPLKRRTQVFDTRTPGVVASVRG